MSDVYKVGMEIALTGGLSQALAGIIGQLGGMEGHVKRLEKGFHAWNVAAIGAGLVVAGGVILHAASKVEEAGEKLAHAKAMLSLGKTPDDMAKLTAAAWSETGKNLRSDITGNVEALQDLYNVLMNTDEAIAGLSGFNLLKNSLDSASGKGADIGDSASTKSIGNAIRSFELEGRTSEAALAAMANGFQKAILALPGKVDGTAYYTQVANAGSSRMGWSDDFATAGVPALMNVLKGKTGTSLNALGNNIADGLTSSVLQGQEQIKYGLQKAANLLDPTGSKAGFAPGSAFEADKLRRDPIHWANDYRQSLKAQGVDVDDKQKMMTVVASIARGNKLLKAALDELLLPASNAQINKEYERIKAMPDNSVQKLNANDPEAVRQALYKQFDSVMQGFGEQLTKTFIPIMQQATVILSAMNQWIGAHPEEVEKIGRAIVAVGAVMVAVGAVAVIAVGVSFAPIMSAIGAVGAAIAAITAFNWDSITDAFKRIGLAFGAKPKWSDAFDAEIDRAYRAQTGKDGLRQGSDMEAHRGRALMDVAKAIPPAQVKVENKTEVKVTLDGNAIAAAVTARTTTRTVNNPAGQDSGAVWTPPDSANGAF